jgi:hypothetical protein
MGPPFGFSLRTIGRGMQTNSVRIASAGGGCKYGRAAAELSRGVQAPHVPQKAFGLLAILPDFCHVAL